MSLLAVRSVCDDLRHAWLDSLPGSSEAVEQGGFVLQRPDGSIFVERWPVGKRKQISVPDHPDGKRGESIILATFHTHPNPNYPYRQEPSRADIRGVRDDPDLCHSGYEGEFVISASRIYRIHKSGDVDIIGDTVTLLQLDPDGST